MTETKSTEEKVIREQLVELLRGGSAHADFDASIGDLAPEFYTKRPKGSPHSAWQLLEHLRIALHDLLVFCTDPKYVAPKWPDDYWPAEEAHVEEEKWQRSVRAVKADLAEFEKLVRDHETNLYAKIPWGDGQTVLREVLLAADHNSYHLGQLVLIRKQLGAWHE
ncbi:DinB family protein [Silvibacterium sp.]|uniref:DinB family protein n=1 Tax=Silvibacterium sp. TaxID=1964179 RepID=UPI0039E3BCA1